MATVLTYDEDEKHVSLPNQRVSRATKNSKKWQRDTINYYIDNRTLLAANRKTKKEMQANWDFYNNFLSGEELKRQLDPFGVDDELEGDDQKYEFYNILDQPFDTLFGEELKRNLEVKAYAINPDIINQKDREFKDGVIAHFIELAKEENNQITEKELQEKLKEFDKKRLDLQSAHEIMVNNIIEMLENDKRLNLKSKFNTGFKNLEIISEEVFRVGHIGNEISFDSVISNNFYVIGMGKSNWIQDGYAWIEVDSMNPHKIIEEFAEELTNKEIDDILKLATGDEDSLRPHQIALIDVEGDSINSTQALPLEIDKEFITLDGDDDSIVDADGNIRIYRIEFLTLRKLGKLSFLDEFGDMQTKWVDEDYVINEEEGESIEWIWINEIMRGTRIGNNIYKKVGVSPVQMRSITNPALVRPSYIGYVLSNNGQVSQSRIDKLMPYQRLYNIWMNKLVRLWTHNIGKAAIIDVARIPSKMSTDEWFMWLRRYNLIFENSFEESKKGMSKGLIAGNMQQNSKVIDLSLAEEINQAIKTLSWIEERVNKISAIPEPRQGNLTGNEGLGVSQQAIASSSNQTAVDFFVHDMVKSNAYEVLVEYAKVIWKDVKEKRQYGLDDLSNRIIDIDGALMNEGEYGVTITNSAQMFELHNAIKQLVHPAMQNGAMLSDVARMYLANSTSKMIESLEESEDKRQEQQLEQVRLQQEGAQAQNQTNMELEKIKHQFKLELLDKEWQYKLQEKQIEANVKSDVHSRDTNENQIEDVVELEKEHIKAESDKVLQDQKLAHEKEITRMELENKLKVEDKKSKNKTTNK